MAAQHVAAHREARSHRLVVANALRVVAAHDVRQFVGHRHAVFFRHLVVADAAQRHIWSHDRESIKFSRRKEAIGDFDNTLSLHQMTVQVVADKHRVVVQFLNVEQANHGKQLFRGDMVDDRAIFDGGHHEFFAFHRAEF